MMTQIGRVNCRPSGSEELWPCKLLKIQHGRQLPFWKPLFAIFQINDKGRLAPRTCHCLMYLRNWWTDRKGLKFDVQIGCASHSLRTTNCPLIGTWSGYGSFQRAIDEPCTLPVSPRKGGTKRDFAVFASKIHLLSKTFLCVITSNFYIWRCLSFFFVAGNHRHFKFNMWVEHSKSQLTDDKPSLKWAWPRHVTYFKRLVPLRYLWNGLI